MSSTYTGLLAALLGLASTAVAGQELVGYVASLEGGGSLMRGDAQARRLRLGEYVLAGDTVSVTPPHRVRIDTVQGPVDPCVPPPMAGECRRHFTPMGSGLVPAAVAGRVGAMIGWFSSPSRNLVTRSSDPPRLRFGGDGPQLVVAGRRGVWVSWVDGEAPFRVTLQSGSETLASAVASDREIRLPAVTLREGPLRIGVTDRSGRTATLPLTARRSAPLKGDLTGNSVDADHRVILEAAELASTDGGAWSFEAAQRLEGVTERVPAADVMRRALAAGEKI